jgi:hypothetical protein
MPRYLIEVAHEPDPVACAKVVRIFLTSGSHLLTHADWGCMDGDHRSWMIVDVADKNEAMGIVPPALRSKTRIVGLNFFSLDQIDMFLAKHSSAGAGDRQA